MTKQIICSSWRELNKLQLIRYKYEHKYREDMEGTAGCSNREEDLASIA